MSEWSRGNPSGARRWGRSLVSILWVGIAGGVITGCPLLELGTVADAIEDYPLPEVEARKVTLVEVPSQSQFAAYYCPQTLDSRVVDFACTAAFGEAPAKEQLTFFFEVEFQAGNNGDVELPVLELLLDLEIFEGSAQQSLGSTCVEFCGESDPECTGEPSPLACTEQVDDVDTREEVLERALELVFIGIVTGIEGGDFDDFEEAANADVRTIPPGDELIFSVRFGVGIEALLDILIVLADDAIDDWVAGEDVVFVIPYHISGKTWIEGPYVGRGPVDFGSLEGEWILD